MKYIPTLISIVTLVVLICFIRGCDKKELATQQKSKVTIVSDTIYNHYVFSSNTYAPAVKTQVLPTKETIIKYQLDSVNIKQQFAALLDSFLAKNYYQDTLHFDSSYIVLKDSISRNLIASRSFTTDLKYPVITNTKTIMAEAKPVAKLYAYGGISSDQKFDNKGLAAGLSFQPRNQKQIFSAGLSAWPGGAIQYDFRLSQLITLKKKK